MEMSADRPLTEQIEDRAKRREKTVLLTVHGANSDGKWQKEVQAVMNPHFECIPYRYVGYEGKRGVVKSIVEPWSLLIAIGLAIPGIAVFIVGHVWGGWPAFGAADTAGIVGATAIATLLIIGLVRAFWQRSTGAEQLKIYVDRSGARTPHIIAHSLGSYLVGRALDKFPDFRLGNVVLVGAILPRSFPWTHILRERRSSVRKVRSECGLSDLLVRTLRLMRMFALDVGDAGNRGFANSNLVHSLEGPYDACSKCGEEGAATVHNVRLRHFGHGDQFLSRNHARSLWLPFLWDFEIEEFIFFIDNCHLATKHSRNQLYLDAEKVIGEIWGRAYSWTGGRTLEDYVKSSIAARVNQSGQRSSATSLGALTDRVRFGLHVWVATADAEHFLPDAELNEKIARMLHPSIAIAAFVEHIVGENELSRV
jgi:pimeloyl-ACP methyl ester carboxylesterase